MWSEWAGIVEVAGFLLVGPFMCLGLYDVSRKLEQGDKPTLLASLTPWRTRSGTMAIFGGALLTLSVVAAMLPGFAGLSVVAPVLGHASWHAYRATVE